jgi:hypothetical protein
MTADRDIHVVAVAAELLDEIGRYVNERESELCGEHHLGRWPECDEDHDDGRQLLRRVGVDPAPWAGRS